jgi:hypothetical protein
MLEDVAYPYGLASVLRKGQLGNAFRSSPGILPGINSDLVDLHFLRATPLIDEDIDTSGVERAFDQAAASGGWLIFYGHDVAAEPSAAALAPRAAGSSSAEYPNRQRGRSPTAGWGVITGRDRHCCAIRILDIGIPLPWRASPGTSDNNKYFSPWQRNSVAGGRGHARPLGGALPLGQLICCLHCLRPAQPRPNVRRSLTKTPPI